MIAVTTAIVESTLLNINKEIDHDSLGLFQQRASWGSRQNRLNPTWATNAFLNAMLQKFPRNAWRTTPIGKVCQRVQVSAFPGRYQPQVADARIIVGALWGARTAGAEQTPMTAERKRSRRCNVAGDRAIECAVDRAGDPAPVPMSRTWKTSRTTKARMTSTRRKSPKTTRPMQISRQP